MRLKEDGTSNANSDFFIENENFTDQNKAPYIDHMFLDDTVSG